MHLDFWRHFQFRQPPQILLQDLSLDRELMFVARVLIVAPTALREVGTTRFDPRRRRLKNRTDSRPCKARLLFNERDLYFLACQHKRHKHGLAAAFFIRRQASQSVSAINQFFNGEVQTMILGHRPHTV